MKPSIHQPHDKFFKLSLAEIVVAKEFFSAHLPANLLKKIDLATLKLEKESFIDEAYKDTEADVVYSARMGDTTTYLYILCEQQTEVDPWLAFRLLGYTVRIMDLHHKQHPRDPLPLVYPIVVYTGDEPWSAPLDIFPLFAEAENLAREIMFKPYQLQDVKRTSDDELRQQELSGLVAFSLKYRRARDFQRFLKELLPWVNQVEVHHAAQGTSLGRIVLKYVIDDSPEGNKDLLVQEAQHYLSQELQGDIMTIAQQWKQEGIQIGVLQGMQRGVEQGEAALLKRQLQHRFGELPLMYVKRIDKADAQTLLYWGEKLLDAKTLDDVFI